MLVWLVVAWCLQSVAYLVTCAFPTISAMTEPVAVAERKRQLSLSDRKTLYFMVQREIDRGSNIHGLFKSVSENFRIAPRQASRVYHKIRKKVIAYVDTLEDTNTNTSILPDQLFEGGNGNRGAKKKWDRKQVVEDIKRIPLAERGNLRSLEAKLNIPYTTLYHMKKVEKLLRPHRSYIKPKLTEENVEWRLDYAWSKVDQDQFYQHMT